MSYKKRILWVNEASFLGTGFSTYGNEVLKRLHAMDDFEIAEMMCYCADNDIRQNSVPWKHYPVQPTPDNQEEWAKYHSIQTAQYGSLRLDNILLDFKPDIVTAITDWWMDEYHERSPYRNYFKWCCMNTVDGIPQRVQWIDTYKRMDKCLTYSEWAKQVLENEGISVEAVASPGVDLDVFKPVADKKAHKQRLGLDPNSYIIGMMNRNQQRKLYHDLIDAYADWYHKGLSNSLRDIVKKTYLYLQTSYPDVGYDIGRAIQINKVSGRVLMTYVCSSCGCIFPSLFSGELTYCKKCSKLSARTPNPNFTMSREGLAAIINCFDVHVQYSISEGWGMSNSECKACGVPIMATDYSAMKDHAYSVGGFPIRVERYFHEPVIQTEQKRALPDNKHLGELLTKFFRMSPEARLELSKQIRRYAEELVEVYGQETKLPRFSWDRTAAIWANIYRTTSIADRTKTWLNPNPNIIMPNLAYPDLTMPNSDFVRWAITNILHKPKFVRSEFANNYIRGLNVGFIIEGGSPKPMNRDILVQTFIKMVEEQNEAEMKRVRSLNLPENKAIGFKII